MQITIHYLAQLKRFAGVASETVKVDAGCTLPGLLQILALRHGGSFRAGLMDDQNRPNAALLFFVGDEQVRGDSSQPLRDGNEVTLLTPMAGG